MMTAAVQLAGRVEKNERHRQQAKGSSYLRAFLGAGPAAGVLAREESTSSSAPLTGVAVPVPALRLRDPAGSPPSDLRARRPFAAFASPPSPPETSFSTREIRVWQRREISAAVRCVTER